VIQAPDGLPDGPNRAGDVVNRLVAPSFIGVLCALALVSSSAGTAPMPLPPGQAASAAGPRSVTLGPASVNDDGGASSSDPSAASGLTPGRGTGHTAGITGWDHGSGCSGASHRSTCHGGPHRTCAGHRCSRRTSARSPLDPAALGAGRRTGPIAPAPGRPGVRYGLALDGGTDPGQQCGGGPHGV
jgi:hypothetical protein